MGRLFLFIIIFVVTSSCLTPPKPTTTAIATKPSGEKGWWQISFLFPTDFKTGINWHLDEMVAHRLAAPQLKQYGSQIDLWRFHRRAGPDKVGHRFSIIFYSDRSLAKDMSANLEANPFLRRLQEQNVIREFIGADWQGKLKPGIEDMSDKNWALEIQKAWPHYGEGISRLWLSLVTQASDSLSAESAPETFDEIQKHYISVHNLVTNGWRFQGKHAFLHHINAMFGYAPMMIKF